MKNSLYLFLFLFVAACQNPVQENLEAEKIENPKSKPEHLVFSPQKFANSEIILGNMEKRNLDSYIKANGMIDVPPSNRASVGTPVGGFVRKADLIVGDWVKKGEVLAILEHPDYVLLQQNYWEAKKRLELAQKTLTREQELKKENASAEKNWEKAENDYQTNKIQVATFAEQLRILGIDPQKIQSDRPQSSVSLIAPFDGFITKMNVNLGKYVNSNEILYELVNKDHLHLELSVFEKDIPKVQKKQAVKFRFVSQPDQWYKGEVFQIAQHFDPQTKSVNIHVHFQQNDKENFKIGMYIEAQIAIGHTENETLPKEAISEAEGEYYVWVAKKQSENYVFRKIKLTKGEENTDYAVVRLNEKIDSDEQIVLKGVYYLNAESNKEE